jgi:hypothetical protein
MAQLAFAGGGAIIGSFFGPMGASIGWALGGLAGGLLFPPKGQNTQGPRLGDLAVQSSTYGAGIPVVYGTMRLAGNLIWSTGIIEDADSRRVGGKGGGGARHTTYKYYASFGISFCKGEADMIRRLWMDDKLVYDATGGSVNLVVPGLDWRWNTGSETQMPDPTYEAAVGTDEAVPYRGEVTAWFTLLPLEQFGNRIPSVSAEVVMTGLTVGTITVQDGPASGGSADHDLLQSIDWQRRKAYTYQNVGGVASLLETDIDTMEARTLGTADADYSRALAEVGDYIMLVVGSGNSSPIVKYDKNTGAELARFGSYSSSLTITTTHVTTAWNRVATAFSVYSELEVRRFLIIAPFFTSVGSYCIDCDEMAYVWGTATFPVFTVPQYALWCEGEQRLDETDLYCAGSSGTTLVLTKVLATIIAYGVVGGAEDGKTTGVTAQVLGTYETVDLGTSGSPIVRNILYDGLDDSVIVTMLATTGPARLIKFSSSGAVVWNIAAPAYEEAGRPGHRLVNGTYGIMGNGYGYLIDTSTGEIISTSTVTGFLSAGAQTYDSERQAIYTWGAGFRRVLIGRSEPSSPTVAEVVAQICSEASLSEGEINVTQLEDDYVDGYVLARPMTGRSRITPLAARYNFDSVESDGVIKFVKRGGAIVDTIPYEELVRTDEEAVVKSTEAQDTELPRRMVVRYIDPERGYENNAQQWQRPESPTATMVSKEDSTVDVPIVMDGDEAKSMAKQHVTAAWRERTKFVFRGSSSHLALEPTDPVTLTLRDGSTVRLRLLSAVLGANWETQFEGVVEDPTDYALTAEADSGTGRPDDVLPTSAAVRGFAPALPLLTDTDDTGGLSLRAYLFGGSYAGSAWYGAEAWRAAGGTYSFVDVLPGLVAWGSVTEEVPVPPVSYFTWDDETEITLVMQSGAVRVESCTDLEALNGANVGVLVSSDGAVEMIAHVNATDNGDGTFTLSRLLRGQRGTENAGAFPRGSIFILLDGVDLRITSALSALGSVESFRFLGLYDSIDYANTVARTSAGRAEQPYAPVHITGARDGSNNLTLDWVRRTRIGGEWLDYSDTVPLSETAEAYEVDIRNPSDTATVRTISGLTSPTTTYSAANQTSDGLTPGDPVVVKVYQMSSSVGRGLPGEATV